MSPTRAEDDGGGPARRARVLSELRSAGTPLGVVEVAHRLGVHANTARFHLDGLVAEGTVVRTPTEPDGPGRPRAVYAPRPGMNRSGARDYLFLSRILLSRLAADGPSAADGAREAGYAWGRHLASPPQPFQRPPTAGQAIEHLAGLLADLHFSPESGDGDGDSGSSAEKQDLSLRLRHCPFLELAEEFGSVVCPMHLGLMQGALEEMNAPVTATGLEPFAEPDACVVRIARTRGAKPKPTTARTASPGGAAAGKSGSAPAGPAVGKPGHSRSDKNRT